MADPDYPELRLVIDGQQIGRAGRRIRPVIDPATDEVIGELPLAEPADLDLALHAAQRGFTLWRNSEARERSAILLGAARLMLDRQEALAQAAVLEVGKPLAEARGEVLGSAQLLEFYAGEVFRIYGRQLVRPGQRRSSVVHEPIGPVAAFAPWNFPLHNVARKLAGPIAAGCSVILKAAEETPASALGMLQCFLDAGLPVSVAQAVFGIPDEVSRHLLGSPIIRKLSFTGSTQVGMHLAELCARDMKRATLELGGHAPVLVFDDADVDFALADMAADKYRNAGQVCVSPTRFLVQEAVFERFRDGFVAFAQSLKLGHGLDPQTQMGPLANARRPAALAALIDDAVARGAVLAMGGHRLNRPGHFFAPTVLSEIPNDARIMNEEPFGPVALINPYRTEEEIIAEANRLPFGLAAYSWTGDQQRQRRIAQQVEAGTVCVNTSAFGGPDAPFGGVKWSGYGHEDGPEGVLACMVTKVVHEG